MSSYRRPVAIAREHDVDAFDCGIQSLNEWLSRRALRNESSGGSRTFVTTEVGSNRVVGYYCTAASSLVRESAPGALRRNAPDPIPVVLIGRLAVDLSAAGHGLGGPCCRTRW